ncbi:thioesterase-like superfamily-domain-containing protein [Hypoxylon sp. FL1150]|nr:thioesterase-like superfamily-domain-containing protein [Hypoxylon sp. FL1150]
MTLKSTVETLVAVAPTLGLGPNHYSNEGPLVHQTGSHAAFGGSLVSQAILAATATVPDGFDVFSCQSSFLRPVDSRQKVNYNVEHAAGGRTFVTRVVRANQDAEGPCLYIAVISFRRHSSITMSEELPTYADPMPAVSHLDPNDIPKQGFQEVGFQIAQPAPNIGDDEPFDWRALPFNPTQDIMQACAHGFVRSQLLSERSRGLHLGSLAFLSDQSLLELVLFANWDKIRERLQSLVMSTTLVHNVSFHDPDAKADSWKVCESKTSWGAGGRAFLHQRFWDLKTGNLVMKYNQEALIGLEQGKSQL